jgi:hypothetical protein
MVPLDTSQDYFGFLKNGFGFGLAIVGFSGEDVDHGLAETGVSSEIFVLFRNQRFKHLSLWLSLTITFH